MGSSPLIAWFGVFRLLNDLTLNFAAGQIWFVVPDNIVEGEEFTHIVAHLRQWDVDHNSTQKNDVNGQRMSGTLPPKSRQAVGSGS